MRIRDIMTPRVQCVAPDVTVESAREMMKIRGIHHLVVEESHQIVGVLSAAAADAAPPSDRVRQRMSRPAIAAPDATLREAANLMRGQAADALVIRGRNGRLAGILTTTDILEAVGKGSLHEVATSRRVPSRPRAT